MTPEQERLLTMLAEIAGICEEHGLAYYVAGGTTLGAVRHAGFIPWDDDVDIMMPRADWNRLLAMADEVLPEGRALCCRELYEDYPNAFGRYVDVTSSCIHRNQLLGGAPEGFAIDVFVLDPVPDAEEAYEEHRETLMLYTDLANPVGYSYPMVQDVKRLRAYGERIEREGKGAVLAELERELSKSDPDECDYVVMRWGGAPRLFPADMLEPARYEMFEGLPVRVPGRCNDYLVRHYGDDWAYIPPNSGRAAHETVAALDVDYLRMQADYLPFINVPRARKAMLARRSYHVKHIEEIRHADDLRASVIGEFARASVEERVRTCGFDVEEALLQHRHAELDWVFCEFYKRQATRDFVGYEEYPAVYRYHHPVYIDIGDDLLRIALLNMVETNRVGKAARILDVRRQVKGELSEGLQSVRAAIGAVRLPASLRDAGRHDEALACAKELLAENPHVFSNRVAYLDMLLHAGDYDELEREAARGLELFGDAGEFEKYLADCLFARAGDDADIWQGALDGYARALELTTNGLIAADAQRRMAECRRQLGNVAERDAEWDFNRAMQSVPGVHPEEGRDLRRKMGALLGELADACEELGMDYCLGPVSCRYAHAGDGEPAAPLLDVLVPAARLSDLAECLRARMGADRALDYWETNENHLTYQVDYVDMTTTFLQIDEGTDIRAHGIKVSAIPVRSRLSGLPGRWLDTLETGWEINGYKFTKWISAKRAVSAGIARAGMVAGKRRLARRLFRSFNRRYGAAGRAGFIRLADSGPVACSLPDPAACETARLYGRDFPVPADACEMLARIYGKDWEAGAPSPPKGSLVSAEIPNERFLRRLAAEGLQLNELFSLMARIRMGMLPLAGDLRARTQAIHIAERSAERKRIYDDLEARGSELRSLLEAEDYARLGEALADYEQSAKRYLKHGLCLCPCKEHLDMLCAVLNAKGEAKTAARLSSLAPREHYDPL